MRFRARILGSVAATALLTGTLLMGWAAFAQDMPAAKDTIFARKILMDTIGGAMNEIEAMTGFVPSSGSASV